MPSRSPTLLCLLLTGLLPLSGSLAQEQPVDAEPLEERLESLSRAEREFVGRRCLPREYEAGAAAYRTCVNDALEARSARTTAIFDTLSFDDRHALQQVCSGSTSTRPDIGGERMQACIDEQISRLVDAPEPVLGVLDEDEREAARAECEATQTRDGVAEYRRCLAASVASVEALATPDLSSLTREQRRNLANRCAAESNTAAAYRRCSLAGASGTAAPAANAVAEADVNLIEASTTDAQTARTATTAEPTAAAAADAAAPSAGATGVSTAQSSDQSSDDSTTAANTLAQAGTTDAPDVDPEQSSDTFADDDAVAAPAVGAAQGESQAGSQGDAQGEGQGNGQVDGQANAQGVDAGAELDAEPGGDGAEGAAGDAAGGAEQTLADLKLRAADALTRLKLTIAGLEEVERVVLGLALALPLLLLAAWGLTRGSRIRKAEAQRFEASRSVRNRQLSNRVRDTSPQHDAGFDYPGAYAGTHSDTEGEHAARPVDADALPDLFDDGSHDTGQGGFDDPVAKTSSRGRNERDLDSSLDATLPNDTAGEARQTGASARPGTDGSDPSRDSGDEGDPLDDVLGEGFAGSLDAGLEVRDDGANAGRKDASGNGATPQSAGAGESSADATEGAIPAAIPLSAFGRWIESNGERRRLELAIEFLIYWMAYGDERYEPETRVRLLADGGDDGDPHDLIKRRVLEQDIDAFADTVRWIQRNASELQRIQILDLLMVLLVSDRAMSPLQNTLLRFLSDAFGIGDAALEERHEIAFGRPMPALPRVDLMAWWNRVGEDEPLCWDARTVMQLDPLDQYRSQLGLPMTGSLDEAQIVEGFRWAARRCHPHRFDALGDRERSLAERQFSKFEEARDRLLGVSA